MSNYIKFLLRVTLILFSILLLTIAFGCKAKVVSTEVHTTDTIYKSEIIKIDKPQLNEIFIETICDSLGNVLPIYYTNTSNNVKTTLKSYQSGLKLEVNVDSIVNSRLSEYKSSLVKEKEVLVKYKIPKWVWYNLIYSVLATLFIFRKPLLMLIKPI